MIYSIFILTYGIHNLLQRLLGYLILFVICAFVPQRQLLHRRLPSPLPSPFGITKFYLSSLSTAFLHITLVIYLHLIKLYWPFRYPLNLIKMNNTSLLRITATAGTQLVKTWYIYCHYQYIHKASFCIN